MKKELISLTIRDKIKGEIIEKNGNVTLLEVKVVPVGRPKIIKAFPASSDPAGLEKNLDEIYLKAPESADAYCIGPVNAIRAGIDDLFSDQNYTLLNFRSVQYYKVIEKKIE